jgi:NAD(P)-dependent dehydrogenase (short-subunit alcohol dehydrogenase family)
VEDLTRDTLRKQFEVNVLGTHELACRLLPAMRANGQGRMVMNSSVLGFVSMPFRGAYNASKYALEGLCDTWRLELKGSGVHVSMIEPGPILSRFRQNAHAAFKANIDINNSVHRTRYQAMETKFLTEGPVMPFTLEPEAVLVKLEKALNARRPKARYPVTVPTYLFAYLKRILPDRALDAILRNG